jgi:hypothetical protein
MTLVDCRAPRRCYRNGADKALTARRDAELLEAMRAQPGRRYRSYAGSRMRTAQAQSLAGSTALRARAGLSVCAAGVGSSCNCRRHVLTTGQMMAMMRSLNFEASEHQATRFVYDSRVRVNHVNYFYELLLDQSMFSVRRHG